MRIRLWRRTPEGCAATAESDAYVALHRPACSGYTFQLWIASRRIVRITLCWTWLMYVPLHIIRGFSHTFRVFASLFAHCRSVHLVPIVTPQPGTIRLIRPTESANTMILVRSCLKSRPDCSGVSSVRSAGSAVWVRCAVATPALTTKAKTSVCMRKCVI